MCATVATASRSRTSASQRTSRSKGSSACTGPARRRPRSTVRETELRFWEINVFFLNYEFI